MSFSIRKLLPVAGILGSIALFMTGCDDGTTSPTPLAISTQPTSQNVAAGNAFSLTVQASSATTYRWVHTYVTLVPGVDPDTSIDTVGTSATYTVPMAAPFDSMGTYKCVVSDGTNRIISNYVTVKVTPHSFPPALMTAGAEIVHGTCAQCHGFPPKGSPGSVPPLIHSDYLMADKHRPIRIVLIGLGDSGTAGTNPITVNGNSYEASMPAIMSSESDSAIAGVLTYIRAVYNGARDTVTPAEVKFQRDSLHTAGRI